MKECKKRRGGGFQVHCWHGNWITASRPPRMGCHKAVREGICSWCGEHEPQATDAYFEQTLHGDAFAAIIPIPLGWEDNKDDSWLTEGGK